MNVSKQLQNLLLLSRQEMVEVLEIERQGRNLEMD